MANSDFKKQVHHGYKAGNGTENGEEQSQPLLSGRQLPSRAQPSDSFFKRTLSIDHLAKSHIPSLTKARISRLTSERLVSRTRFVLRILSLILLLALVTVLGHAVAYYYSTKGKKMFDEALRSDVLMWPEGLKMRPTLLLLGATSVAACLSLIICIASFSRAVSPYTPVLSSSHGRFTLPALDFSYMSSCLIFKTS